MNKGMTTRVLAGCLLLGNAAMALAGQEVSVGRVDLLLPGEGWQVQSLPDQGNAFSGAGHTHQQEAELKLIARPGAEGVLDALFVVRANASGKGRFSGVLYPGHGCTAGPAVLAEGDEPGEARRSFRCLQVGSMPADQVPQVFPAPVLEWVAQKGWRLPPSATVVSAQQHAHTGAFAVALILLRPLAPVEAGAPSAPEALPIGVTASDVRWARQMQEAVSDSVYSLRGKLPVPELAFADRAVGAPNLPADTKPPTPPARVPAPGTADRG